MKFLQDKTPAERKKTIAALVLGFLAVVALAYTFLFSGSSSKSAKGNTNGNGNSKTVVVVPNNNSNRPPIDVETPEKQRDDNEFYGLTPIPENPFPPVYADAPARNIFAFYVPPPPPVPKPVQPSPLPMPSPPPPPDFFIQYANPQTVYARQGDFTLEVGGDKFTPDAKVLFNGMEVPTQFQAANRLTAQVSAALIADAGDRQITVNAPGKISNSASLIVNAPPVPNFNFVGLVARQHFNNDTATIQERSTKAFQNVRLGETVGRFKIVSISSKEVVMQDTQLNFRHNIPFYDEKNASARNQPGATGTGSGRGGNPPANNGFPPGFDPNNQIQYQSIPGIPGQYVQPQMQIPAMPQPTKPTDDVDDDGDNY